MTMRIEIPADNKELAGAIGRALIEYAGETTKREAVTQEVIEISQSLDADNGQCSSGEMNNELDPVDTATTAGGSMETLNSDGAGAEQQSTGGKNDEKGVTFIPAICGNATIPFYASGPRKGQWKKLRGVTEQEYDQVYALALGQVANTGVTQQQSAATEQTAQEVFGTGLTEHTQPQEHQQQTATTATPQQVFELYSTLVQGGKVEAANGVMQKHGLANGTLIYGRPDLADVIFQELQAV